MANSTGLATCDAGFKALATDAGRPSIVLSAPDLAAQGACSLTLSAKQPYFQ